jgi:hypothetical protein
MTDETISLVFSDDARIAPHLVSSRTTSCGEDEGEERDFPVGGVLHVHHQGGIEDAVRGIGRFVWEIELRRENRLVRSLGQNVDVPRASGVETRNDRLQHKPSFIVSKLVAPQPVANVVVDPRIVGLPEVEQCAGDRLACGVIDIPADNKLCPRYSWLEQ